MRSEYSHRAAANFGARVRFGGFKGHSLIVNIEYWLMKKAVPSVLAILHLMWLLRTGFPYWNAELPIMFCDDMMEFLMDKPSLSPKHSLSWLPSAPNQSTSSSSCMVEAYPTREIGGVFVGRQREMAQLSAALEDALAGHGRLVMLAGEPGIGKTRTAQELAVLAETKGVQVLWGWCYEEKGAPPYWPWGW